jgi:hypothetical protein
MRGDAPILSSVEDFGSMIQGVLCSYGCLVPDTLLQRFHPPTSGDCSPLWKLDASAQSAHGGCLSETWKNLNHLARAPGAGCARSTRAIKRVSRSWRLQSDSHRDPEYIPTGSNPWHQRDRSVLR